MINSIISSQITVFELLICLFAALIFGALLSIVFSYKNKFSSSLILTITLLPLVMAMITILINGNLGMAVAVAGGFTLVRFRSIKGTGKEVTAIFTSMVIGTICGMGYIMMALIFFVIICLSVFVLQMTNTNQLNKKILKITIPEEYDYEHLFDDVFEKYNVKAEIVKLKTTNMGSLIDVTYEIELEGNVISKDMLDDLRSKNANLAISLNNIIDDRECL